MSLTNRAVSRARRGEDGPWEGFVSDVNHPRHAADYAAYRAKVEADPSVLEFRALMARQGRGPWQTRTIEPGFRPEATVDPYERELAEALAMVERMNRFDDEYNL